MEYKEIFKSAVQALRTNILRTSLTMLGIIIGITSVIPNLFDRAGSCGIYYK